MGLEMCDICDKPTGNAGRMDDSYICCSCDRVICANCGTANGEGEWMCCDCQERLAEEEEQEDDYWLHCGELEDFTTGRG